MFRRRRRVRTQIAVIAAVALVVGVSACGSDDGGSGGSAQAANGEFKAEYRGDRLQPLEDGFPSDRITLFNADEPASSDGLYARTMQKALNRISPVRIQVVDRPNPDFGTWSSMESIQRERGGKDGYVNIVTAFTGAALDFLTAPITPELGFTIDTMNPVLATEQVPFVLIARDDAPFDTYEELVAAAKADPGKLRYLALGVGSQLDIAMERLMAEGGYKAKKVPLDDPVQITTAIAAGEGDFAMMLPDVALGQSEAGRIKVLLAIGDTAPEPWTDATTTKHLGLDEPWGSLRGFMVPPEVPESHRLWLEELFRKASESDEYKERIEKTPGASLVNLDHDAVLENATRASDLAEPLIRDLGLHYEDQ
jgi:tripartite-type tricarboxylate transporter receptor subunit TctC